MILKKLIAENIRNEMIYQKYVMCLFNKIDIKRTLILNFLSIFLYNYFIDPKECNSLQKRSQCLFVGLTVLTKSRESHLHPLSKVAALHIKKNVLFKMHGTCNISLGYITNRSNRRAYSA